MLQINRNFDKYWDIHNPITYMGNYVTKYLTTETKFYWKQYDCIIYLGCNYSSALAKCQLKCWWTARWLQANCTNSCVVVERQVVWLSNTFKFHHNFKSTNWRFMVLFTQFFLWIFPNRQAAASWVFLPQRPLKHLVTSVRTFRRICLLLATKYGLNNKKTTLTMYNNKFDVFICAIRFRLNT